MGKELVNGDRSSRGRLVGWLVCWIAQDGLVSGWLWWNIWLMEEW